MHVLIVLVIDWLLPLLMELLEYIMCLLVLVFHFFKDIKMKSLRFHLIHREIR